MSRVGSPPYLRSWGIAPTAANWKTTFPSPSVVSPSSTACGPTRVRAPILTLGPITAYGPTSTLESSSACLSTIAVGWIATSVLSVRNHRHHLCLARRLAVHFRLSGEPPDGSLLAFDAHVQIEPI